MRARRRRGLAMTLVVGLSVPLGLVGSAPASADSMLAAGERRCFAVTGSPGDVALVNLTPLRAEGRGYGLLVSSDTTDVPMASNVNFDIGTTDPNVAATTIGADGNVCYLNSEADTHLLADHLGTIDADTYTPAQTNGAPLRKLDTRPVPAPTMSWRIVDEGAPARCVEMVERVNTIIGPYLVAANLNGTITVSPGPSGVLAGSAGGSSIRILCSSSFLPEAGVQQVVTHEFMHIIQGNVVADWIWPYADHVQFGTDPNTRRSLFEHQADTMARLACDRVGLACSSGAYGVLPEQIPDSAKLLEYVGL